MAEANSRINLGVIGCGARGSDHIKRIKDLGEKNEANVAVVAVCDIYRPRKEAAQQAAGAKVFHDYREMLAMKDLDGVVIATPDHWHARMCMDAMEAGKDVYCESPMAHRWEDALQVHQAVNRTQRVLQVGATACSDPRWRKAHEIIKEKKLGALIWSQASLTRNSEEGEGNTKVDPSAGPDDIDWERFLGPAPWRPFDPERFFRHEKYWDYSLGAIKEDGKCGLYGLQAAIGPEFPKRIVSAGGRFVYPDREVPDTFHIILDYPTEHTIVVAATVANESGLPNLIRGKEASMYLDEGALQVRPERIYSEDMDPIKVPIRTPKDLQKEHHRNFLQCMRTRRQPNCPAALACKVTVALALAVQSFREDKVILFDPQKETVIG